MADDYESMTVAQLKDLLKEQGLPVSGKKADLIERLAGAAEEEDAPVEETEASSDAEENDDDFFEEDDDWDDDEDEGMLQSKSQSSMKQPKKHLHFVQHRRRRLHLSVELSGSDTSDCLVPVGELRTEWTTSNVATTSIEVPSYELDTVRLPPHVVFIHPVSEKSWSTTSTIWNPSILKLKRPVLAEPLVAESVRTFTPVLMNWVFVS